MSDANGRLALDAHSNSAEFVSGDAEHNGKGVELWKSKLTELLHNANYKTAALCADSAFSCFLQGKTLQFPVKRSLLTCMQRWNRMGFLCSSVSRLAVTDHWR